MKRSEDAKKDREMKEFFNSQVQGLICKKVVIKASLLMIQICRIYTRIIDIEEKQNARAVKAFGVDIGYLSPKIPNKRYEKIDKLKDKIIDMLYKAKIEHFEPFDIIPPNQKVGSEMLLAVEDITNRLELKDYKEPAKYQRLTLKQLKRMDVKSK